MQGQFQTSYAFCSDSRPCSRTQRGRPAEDRIYPVRPAHRAEPFEDPSELTLDLNTDHKLYKEANRQGHTMHRLHCAWLVSLALAERAHPISGHAVADFLEALSYELYSGWGRRRRS